MKEEQVVLVDQKDNQLGLMDKLEAHQNGGRLHRAISVLIYRIPRQRAGRQNSDRDREERVEVLLQKRSKKKWLWPGYWADTTSSHPREGESYVECAVRRLKEEMGMRLLSHDLRLVFKLVYHARYNQDLSEREVDGILIGRWDGDIKVNEDEVEDYKWAKWEMLEDQVRKNGETLAPWLRLMIGDPRVMKFLQRGGG